jgi:tetratricopeptide (TPR) repeat protein
MKAGSRSFDSGIFGGLLIAAVTVLIYLPVRHHQFLLFDDADYVTDNPAVQAGLTWSGVSWAFTHFHSSNWHPLTWLSHMLDVQLFGRGPSGPHLVNVLLHAANAVLVFLLLRRWTGAWWRSALVAALFALHPLHIESVAWIAERKDVLSAFFGLLTLWGYTNYVAASHSDKARSRIWYGSTLLCFALGLMSKPMLVTLPFVLLLLDYWPLARISFPASVREKIPYFLLSAVSCVVTFLAQQQSGVVRSLTRFSLLDRLENALVSYARYLGKLVWPSDLAAFYPHPGHWPTAAVVAAGISLFGMGVAAWCWRRRAPFLVTGGLWFLGMLVPTIGLVQVSDQAMADRYTYLPSIGVFIILAWGAVEIVARWPSAKPAIVATAGLAVMGCGLRTEFQLPVWHDNETLFRHALAVTQGNFAAHYNLANALLEKGQVDEALIEFENTLAIRPDYADAECNFGSALLQKSRVDEARAHFRKACEIQPDHGPARCNLGITFLQQGKLEEALAEFQKALEAQPKNATAHFLLGNGFLQQGRWDEAIAHYERTLEIHFGHADAHNNLGVALLQEKRVDEALPHFEKALAIQPDHANANNNLADVLMQRGLPAFAIGRYQKVLAVQPGNADAHFNLGSALLLRGRLDEAMAEFEQTLQLQPGFAPAHNNLSVILLQKKRPREAVAHLQTAVELQPENARSLAALAWVQATSSDDSVRNGTIAIELAQRANQLSGNQDPDILRSLAAAYAESGRFAEAVPAAQRALQFADAQTGTELAEALQVQLKFYQAGSPYRDASSPAKMIDSRMPMTAHE